MRNYPKIAVTTQNGDLMFLEQKDIVYCSSEGGFTHIFTIKNKKITVSKRLKTVLDLLSDNSFVRIHHSHIINLDYIDCYRKNRHALCSINHRNSTPYLKNKNDRFLRKIY